MVEKALPISLYCRADHSHLFMDHIGKHVDKSSKGLKTKLYDDVIVQYSDSLYNLIIQETNHHRNFLF